MAVKYLNIGEESYPISFGMLAFKEFDNIFDVPIKNMVDEIPALLENASLDTMLTVTWIGINDGYRRLKQEVPITKDDLADKMDEAGAFAVGYKAMIIAMEGFNALVRNLELTKTGQAVTRKKTPTRGR